MASQIVPVLILLLVSVSLCPTLNAKRSRRKPREKPPPEPSTDSVFQRQLVTSKAKASDIVQEHGRYWVETNRRHFNGTVLAYVTPWNSKGYDIAKKFPGKFTHVSPVWYQLKRQQGEWVLSGGHDVDHSWMDEVQQQGGRPKIVPRLVLEGPDLQLLLTDTSERRQALGRIVQACREHQFNGIVLEAWSAWSAAGVLSIRAMRVKALQFVAHLGRTLKLASSRSNPPSCSCPEDLSPSGRKLPPPSPLSFILVIPPVRDLSGADGSEYAAFEFTSADLQRLAPFVDAFSLMTYDFSNAHQPGYNAPLPWITACLQQLLPGVRPADEDEQEHGEMDSEARTVEQEVGGGEEEESWLEDVRKGRELRSVECACAGEEEEVELAGSMKEGEGGEEYWRQLASKVLLGLNFYGNDFVLPQGGGPLLGHDFVTVLEQHQPDLQWDEKAGEHHVEYMKQGERHVVVYPTLASIHARIKLARAWRLGLSIWEIGQGLDYFYDLL